MISLIIEYKSIILLKIMWFCTNICKVTKEIIYIERCCTEIFDERGWEKKETKENKK